MYMVQRGCLEVPLSSSDALNIFVPEQSCWWSFFFLFFPAAAVRPCSEFQRHTFKLQPATAESCTRLRPKIYRQFYGGSRKWACNPCETRGCLFFKSRQEKLFERAVSTTTAFGLRRYFTLYIVFCTVHSIKQIYNCSRSAWPKS